jgi:hypothetical protein
MGYNHTFAGGQAIRFQHHRHLETLQDVLCFCPVSDDAIYCRGHLILCHDTLCKCLGILNGASGLRGSKHSDGMLPQVIRKPFGYRLFRTDKDQVYILIFAKAANLLESI